MIQNAGKPHLSHSAFALCALLGLTTSLTAQDIVTVRREPYQGMCIFKSGLSGKTVQAYVLIPGGTPGQFQTAASPQLRVGQELSCFEVDPTLDGVIATASSTSFLFIPILPTGDSPTFDLMLPIPRHAVLDYPEGHSIADNVIPLTRVYVPPTEELAVGDKSNWKAVVNGQGKEIESVKDAGGVVTIILKDMPGNGRKVKLIYKEKQAAEFSIAVATVGVPKGTKDDPVGDSDVYLGFNFARSKFSEKSPQDSYGLQLHAAFDYRVPARGNSLLSLRPTLDLLANAPNQADDENAGSVAVPLVWLYLPNANKNQPPPFWAERLVLQGGPKFEGTKDFRVTNFIYNAEFHLIPQIWIHPFKNKKVFTSTRFDFDPQVGYEGGSTIHNPIRTLNQRTISRLKTNGLARFTLFVNKTLPLSAIAFQVNYTYRYLFEPELISSPVTVDYGPGSLIPDDGSGSVRFPGASVEAPATKLFDTGPRRYVDVSLRFIVNKNWEFVSSFTRGELPPAYKHVDKLQTGVAFRFKIRSE